MKEIGKLIDVSVWTGKWPFINLRYGNMDVLREKLKAIKVSKAFIAPIDGILEQDPMRADRELLRIVKDDIFSPVPVIDLSYQNWQECMELALADSRVRMVKLIPNYHMYNMYEKDMDRLVGLAQGKGIVISVQMRIEDPRAHYPLMKVPNVDYNDVVKTFARFPDQVFILNCASVSDASIILESLGNVYMDISCLEHQDILEELHNRHTLDRFLFASHCPFFFPEANVNKLKYSSLDMKEIEKVAYKNAERILP